MASQWPARCLRRVFGNGLAALVAQGVQAGRAQRQQGAEEGAAFLDHTEAGVGDPVVLDQCLLEHGQGDALLFQLDDAVQSSAQDEATIGLQLGGIRALLDMPGRQVGRGDAQRTIVVQGKLDTGERLP